MMVRIENGGAQPLLVSYDRFRLKSGRGQEYPALPLFRVEGAGDGSWRLFDPFVVRQQKFRHSGFRLAPHYRGIYRGIDAWDGALPISASSYALYRTYDGKPLPTTAMRRWGLPEGVLAPGGFVEGYLYFEDVDSSDDGATLEYDALDPQTRGDLGLIMVSGLDL